ncbi:MAG: ATP-binding protein [Phototrophicaceae bacterium]
MTETDAVPSSNNLNEVSPNPDPITAFLTQFQAINLADRTSAKLAQMIANAIGCTHTLILSYDKANATLDYSAAYPKPIAPPSISINTFNLDEQSPIATLIKGDLVSITTQANDTRLQSLNAFIKQDAVTLVPLMQNDTLLATLVLYNDLNKALTPAMLDTSERLRLLLTTLLEMILQSNDLKETVDHIEREAEIFSRIDEELNDTIELNYVFTMIKDWALRFTNADAAALSLYNSKTEALRIMSQYGFKPNTLMIDEELPKDQGGIMLRVARQGLSEIVHDITSDNDYYALADGMLTQMTVPIKREEKVIGVLTLLSRQINGFTDEHLDFTKRLSSRAGVAIDNARLFTETKREREKLSYILRNIADNVILVGLNHRIEMINSSSILAFHLSADQTYVGNLFTDVITHSKLQASYQEAVENDDTVTVELALPNERTYHTTISHHQGIGRIIVMQDITYFKETDRLKTELVATVSHDLKQPLAVMRGYLDLLNMTNKFDERSKRYIDNLNLAFHNMQQLIDDLLDIARIEAGLTLDLETVSLADVLNRSINNVQQPADAKKLTLEVDIAKSLPLLSGDPKRLEQIFNNLINNAVKYTAPEGHIKVYTEVRQDVIRVFIKDDGLGIGAEDQAKIFERFYRVRRPETDSIEGTGLGLAIVKSLVEAHDGKIDLKSVLGEGSTFRVTLPILP